MNFRIGFGYDTHRLVTGRPLILGGIQIPFEKGLKGHSDADALLHAICDALLGAIAMGDIGQHFSDQDPQYAGIDSKILLEKVNNLLQKNGYQIGNLDATIIAEAPKMAPHIPAMRQCIAAVLKISEAQVSIKATTHEKMGPMGNGEGIAVHCVAMVYHTNLPDIPK